MSSSQFGPHRALHVAAKNDTEDIVVHHNAAVLQIDSQDTLDDNEEKCVFSEINSTENL